LLQPGELNYLYIQDNHLHFRRSHARFSTIGLGEGQPKLLRRLSAENGLSQAELARRCNLEPATVTVNLCRMEKSGLIERRPDADDLRITRIFLTDAGWEMIKVIERLHLEIEEECFSGFSAEEREQMNSFLVRMRDNMRNAQECQRAGEGEA
jgi:MarR family transcriptional regulator, organic hydroperoxide resistance regulator